MSRFGWLVVILLLILPKPIFAQNQPQIGCDQNTPSSIAATEPYKTACQTYVACLSSSKTPEICGLDAFMSLHDSCQDTYCDDEAVLDTSAIRIFSSSYISSDDGSDASQIVWQAVSKGLSAFHSKNYRGALTAYQSTLSDILPDSMINLGAGVIDEVIGDDTHALSQYSQSVQAGYNDPLIYYALGNFNIHREHSQEAAADFTLMSDYAEDDTVAEPFIKSLTTKYPLNGIQLDDWLAYPVLLTSGGIGGESVVDQSQMPPRPVKLAAIDNQSAFVAQNLQDDLFTRLYQDLPDLLILTPASKNTYEFGVTYTAFDATWGGTLQLTMSTNQVAVSEQTSATDSGASSSFLLAPVDKPDPRLFFASPRCPGAALSYLKIGATGSSSMEGLTSFTVLEGPQCADNEAKWLVKNDSGKTGWITESDGNNYLVYSDDDTAIPPHCDVTLPPRLMIGGHGSVVAGQGVNNLRSEPKTSADTVGSIPEGATFDVLMGPTCADGFDWWQVRYNGVEGWTAESQGNQYWLQPA